ncbi:ribonuclease H [Candidatus Uhrbacteria bacterium CG10_big_fil_rev_8_21_14_0_10_48_11]|uniref:Ribonuclease H n=1 Tax=Candidatus Uhrbacteria bacterium CG10_big_fil_rev_8_21_14_0_10_48_11 TaxID=1975037 RepID=A0A2M8LFL9_9BACT|nr:MAG: ribonuclease H [Candidatus Uhrbacteria bacterium CG10_big_fil_rev_8_21_14_0_10_48_11]
MTNTLHIHTDGGSRGNPGPAALGVYITDEKGTELIAFGKYLGITTNNQAEYSALIAALEEAKKMSPSTVHCFLDSELVVKQIKREYRVKNVELQPLFLKVWNLASSFPKITFTHVPRERNKEADRQVNIALDSVDK